jgi:hypothetical protein
LGSALTRRRSEADCHGLEEFKREAVFAIYSPTPVLCLSLRRKINLPFWVGGVLKVLPEPNGNLSRRGLVNRAGIMMKRSAGRLLLAILFCSSGFAAQQTSPSSPHGDPQDVPKQRPGTENPDVGKGERPTPDTHSTKNKDDVPEQKPGTENPDVAKDKRSEKPDTSTGGTGKSKTKTKGKARSTSTSSSH